MMETLTRPFVAAWGSLVGWHRTRLDNDPDVERVRTERQRAERVASRLDLPYRDINRAAFGRDPWPREKGRQP